jgi:hypothetical protein
MNISYLLYFIKISFLVCIKTVSTFADTLPDEEKTSPEKIDKAFKKYCGKTKVDSKEHRLVNI